MPEIVLLDGHTMNPGDLSWEPLERLGRLTRYARSAGSEVAERAAGAAIVLTNKTPVTREAIERLPELRYVGVLATGVNVVEIEAARERGVVVTNVPGYSTASVAQHAIALLLELTNRVGDHDASVHRGGWAGSPDFSYTLGPVTELADKTFGVIGMGATGQAAARIAAALGMRIAAAHQRSMDRVAIPGVEIAWMEHDALVAEADVVSLHCPLTPETRGLMGPDRLARMKPGAMLINTGRGPLVDEAALAAALCAGRIGGAGLDVLSEEPPPPSNPLLSAPRCVITPHNAWASVEARARLMEEVAANIEAHLRGETRNRVA